MLSEFRNYNDKIKFLRVNAEVLAEGRKLGAIKDHEIDFVLFYKLAEFISKSFNLSNSKAMDILDKHVDIDLLIIDIDDLIEDIKINLEGVNNE